MTPSASIVRTKDFNLAAVPFLHNPRTTSNGRVFPSVMERFWDQVSPEPNSGCWLWTGFLINGYAAIAIKSSPVKASRFSYEYFKGPIPRGLVIDHKCRVPVCVNPDHLETVTDAENLRRGFSPSALNTRKTHCVRGHQFSVENTAIRVRDGGRICRACYSAKHPNSKMEVFL